ncbi:hypothetical protein HDU97_002542 [Phlyctochytrium planicorne]|nr:hypothetical protein HDU97_002542 [Phlyctochytrium planicorne]
MPSSSPFQERIVSRNALCWNFGSTSPVRLEATPFDVFTNGIVMPLYPNGTSAGFPLFSTLPCIPGYSDAWGQLVAIVPSFLEFNHFTDYISIQSVYMTYPTGKYLNLPVVTPGSMMVDTSNVPTNATVPKIRQGWYQLDIGYFENSLDVIPLGGVLMNKIVDFYLTIAIDGISVVDAVQGDPMYSGFYA